MSSTLDLSQTQNHYQAYMIRMWRSADESPWRASAQHAVTGATVTFANLESLFRFLHDQSVEGQVVD